MFKKVLVIPFVLVLGLGLAACGGDDDGDDNGDAGPPVVEVGLAEWHVSADPIFVSPGEITFNTSNEGGLPHELVVLRTDIGAGSLPVSDAKVDLAAAGEVIGEIETDMLPAGGSASATFNLPAGNYVLLCNVPAHYEQGMRSAFGVQ